MPNQSILETLYQSYLEKQTGDSAIIREYFQKLNECIAFLSLRENDKICDIVCLLCTEYERRAYTAGFRDCYNLTQELRYPEGPS